MSNPISELISDKQYESLADKGLLKFTAIRNIEIKRRFKAYKKCGMKSKLAIIELMDRYHLGRKSIEIIIYNRNNRKILQSHR